MTLSKLSPWVLGLVQATGLLVYIVLVGLVITNGNQLFGPGPNVLGFVLFLSLFVFSALVCAAIMLAYPFYLFWEKKDTKTAAKVIFASAAWLFLFLAATLWLLLAGKL